MSVRNVITSIDDLERWKQEGLEAISPKKRKVTVGMATCGLASGAKAVFDALTEEFGKTSEDIIVAKTGCLGFCQMEPIVEVFSPGQPRLLYKQVTADKAVEIVSEIISGKPKKENILCAMTRAEKWDASLFPASAVASIEPAEMGKRPNFSAATKSAAGRQEAASGGIPRIEDIPFYGKQEKIALSRCGCIDPESLSEYIATGGYFTLWKVLTSMKPDEVIAEVERSGLRGRGGAGFPTGRKWQLTRKAAGNEKYIVCNADEGDPGAYMDRSLLEGDPFAILEGMTIGAYAIGRTRLDYSGGASAQRGFIYVRDEYPLAVENLNTAVERARAVGLLGQNIMGTGFSFDVRLIRGGGAFVCGEETALIASIEGRPGEPKQRPPYPAEKGLWGKPTNINNVETWANVPWIISHGADAYRSIGTESSKGTKVFSIVGKINNTGLIEVPMGLTLREIVHEIGGGIPGGKKFKAVQTGGPSGGCIPESLLDLPVDYESLTQAGAIMGSGGMIVMDEDTCMVDVARYFLDFLKEESCGKCAPCREGIDRALEILERICHGKGKESDIDTLEGIAQMMKGFALCALGTTAPNPLLSTIRYFRDEYEAHIRDGRCPAGVCRDLIVYRINPEKCTGCMLCAKICPQGVISGERKQVHVIDESRCIKCGMCFEVCKQDAIEKE
jgi:NADH:ubiquinone oxidoreductase subunit F (NADH-binding)/(2Fe-2S) ferredoxin/NAD-dependent dihydropyrimidine dehydrogenase PreA subunit